MDTLISLVELAGIIVGSVVLSIPVLVLAIRDLPKPSVNACKTPPQSPRKPPHG